jgi:hypothetical protein
MKEAGLTDTLMELEQLFMLMATNTREVFKTDCVQVEFIYHSLDGDGRYVFSAQSGIKAETIYIGGWLNDKFHGAGQLYV